jgi:hypothetical protein
MTRRSKETGDLFFDGSGQLRLVDKSAEQQALEKAKVECLGMTFDSEDGYHTKVPHLAIVPSILHYTEPGDIVLDGFAGSGMTGVAAQWCGSAPADYRNQLEAAWSEQGLPKPKWGARRAVLSDLGPAASFIAANYTLPFNVTAFSKAAQRILLDVEKELGWMCGTLHADGKFETYKHAKERKLKLFRTEAVRAGFRAAYEGQDYRTIVTVAAKLPENVLQEDEKLLMYYDVASMRHRR